MALLNGGNAIQFTDSLFALPDLPADFEQWYALTEAMNPSLQWVKQKITIPLWENRNTVKYAKAQTIALQSVEADSKLQFTAA